MLTLIHPKLKKLSSTGDTIVEVIIVLAVIGLAASMAYAIGTTSLTNVRQSEEHSEASVVAQSQVEGIRQLSQSDPTDLYGRATPVVSVFCVESIVSPANTPAQLTFTPVTDSSHCANFNATDAHANANFIVTDYYCPNVHTTGTPCDEAASNAQDLFLVNVAWPDAAGDGTDSTTLSYQVYPQ